MIRSFASRDTEVLFGRGRPRRIPGELHEPALIKLLMLHAATEVTQLRVPPGNRLEKLRGDRAGQWSIRINKRWRVCFDWDAGHAHNVEIVDYH